MLIHPLKTFQGDWGMETSTLALRVAFKVMVEKTKSNSTEGKKKSHL